MDTSTYEILKECNSDCRMAVNSIEQLVVYLKNQELQELFSNCLLYTSPSPRDA